MGQRGEEAAAAARAVAGLVRDHAGALDGFAGLAIRQGLRGPGALRIGDEYHQVRGRLHTALRRAWSELADAARRDDASPGAEPEYPPIPFLGSSAPHPEVAIDVPLLEQAVRAAERGAGELEAAAGRLGTILYGAGVPDSHSPAVRAAATWLRTQGSGLRRRITAANAAEAAVSDVFADALVAGALTGADPRLSALTGAELAAYAELRRIQAGDGGRSGSGGGKSGTDRITRTAAWWSQLPQSTRDKLTAAAPNVIGSLNGLPATDRDKANRAFMTQEKRRLNALTKDPFELNKPGGAQQNSWASQQLAAIKAVETRIAREGKGGYPKMYLLAFDTQGPGHAAVAFGNPDSADNVVTFVPGFGTTMAGTAKNMERIAAIKNRADAFAPDQSTASIYWLGYDPPQPDGSAAFAAFERQAATATRPLGEFMQGLEAARGDSGSAHTTILGHSYGSLAAGKTAVAFPHLADELVFVGSPGVSVERAEQLGIHPKHVWASAAPDDNVARTLPPRGSPLKPQFWLDMATDQGPFGTRPTSPLFGGKTFFADEGGHGGYWDNKSPSLKNIGRIVVDQDPTETKTR